MNYFPKLPLAIRLLVVFAFLGASIVVGVLGRPSRILLLVSALLFLLGGWRISKARSFVLLLILVPALVGLLLTHFDWRHPFFTRYSAGLFSVIAALLLIDGIRIEEWIEITRMKYGRLSFSGLGALLIGTAVGTISLSANIQEQRTCRKLANLYRWRTKPRMSIFLDGIALPFYNAVESHEFIDEALNRWTPRNGGRPAQLAGSLPETAAPVELVFGNSSFIARLSDMNDFPLFPDFRSAILSAAQLPEPWKAAIARLQKPATILEIGDHARSFANLLLENGFDVLTVDEKKPALNKGDDFRLPKAEYNPGNLWLQDGVISRCDHIFLHQSSFLDAINELGLQAVLRRLQELSKPEAHICFDYPAAIGSAPRDAVLSGQIGANGEVKYRYSRHEQDGDIHKGWLEYTVRREHEIFCVRTPLMFVAPDLGRVLSVASECGFSHAICAMPGSFSFFGGELTLIELRKQRGVAGE